MPISNASYYAYNVSELLPTAPYIGVSTTAGIDEVASACSAYLENASDYADEYQNVMQMRDYVKDRFMYDLCAGASGIAHVNKQENTISLHEKANEIYSYALGSRNIGSIANVNAIVRYFDNFYSTYYMNDEKTECVLNMDPAYYGSAVAYDSKAVVIDGVVGESRVFVNETPNLAGSNEAQYAAYATIVEDPVYVNEQEYTVAYNSEFQVGEETVGAWEMKTAGDNVITVAYTTDDFNSDAQWVLIEQGSSSSDEESSSEEESPVEEESSSSEIE